MREPLGVLLLLYLLLVAAVIGGMAGLAAVLQRRGHDPRSELAGIPNFRVVDERVWAGGQPSAAAYEELASRGVRTVVDLRSGSADDPRPVDMAQLEALGVEYVSVPVRDGHVPSESDVDAVVAAIDRAPGTVFVHCGGGVGRSSSVTAAYRRAVGGEVPLMEHLAIGPHTVAQVVFLATGRRGEVVRRVSEVLDAPRRARSRWRARAQR